MGYEGSMAEREPGFFSGLDATDFVGIGIAFLFSMGAMYLLWRMLFGPPLFEPAIQAEIRAVQQSEAPPQPDIHTGPGEVSVGIGTATQKNQTPQNQAQKKKN